MRVETGILAEDRLLEVAQRAAGLESELVAQHPSSLPVDVERLRLAVRPVEGEHALAAEALAERMLTYKPLELGDERRAAPQCKLGLDPFLDAREPKLLEAGDLRLRERLLAGIPPTA